MTDLRLDKFAPHVFSTKDLCEKAYGIGKCARINHIDGWSPSVQELLPANEAINWNKHRYEQCIDSNLESGRYISRVGRASRFLSLYVGTRYPLSRHSVIPTVMTQRA